MKLRCCTGCLAAGLKVVRFVKLLYLVTHPLNGRVFYIKSCTNLAALLSTLGEQEVCTATLYTPKTNVDLSSALHNKARVNIPPIEKRKATPSTVIVTMDFSRLQHVNFDLKSSNDTLSSVPSALMEALIPGYRIIYQIVHKLFGIDIGLVVSGCLIAFGLVQGMTIIYRQTSDFILSYFTSTIYISMVHPVSPIIMDWMAHQPSTRVGRKLQAVSPMEHSSRSHPLPDDDDLLDDRGIFNFTVYGSPLIFELWFGKDTFYFEGRSVTITREKHDNGRSGMRDFLALRCLGRSTAPIQALLDHVRVWKRLKLTQITEVIRPNPKHNWQYNALRPHRPMSSISLDQASKIKIIQDFNEYIHPATARWYAARGIPYRRGYLLHGPPGTGKTSFSFALAGLFGLDVYSLSLNETGMTDTILCDLFSRLPLRCIILLEDIDSAGLHREGHGAASLITANALSPSETDFAEEENTQPTSQDKSSVSLSGLLNAIDGAASTEGRVLIMTSNRPETLDKALIRPGRIDFQVYFGLATHDQIEQIFTRMYSTKHDTKKPNTTTTDPTNPTTKSPTRSSSSPSSKKVNRDSTQDQDILDMLANQPVLAVTEPANLAQLARAFATQIPDGVFSPAEIQGYLLQLKREPRQAVAEVGKWRDELLATKKEKKKGRGGVADADADVDVSALAGLAGLWKLW